MKKIVKKVINKISTIDLDLDKTYQLQRTFYNIIHFNYLQIFDKKVNTKILNNGYEVPVRIFFPRKNSNNLIIYIHGGGWVCGSVDNYDRICSRISKETNCIVLAIDYRLAPEYPFPIGLEDCYSVVEHLFSTDNLLDIDKNSIILMGDSAGGNLVAAISIMAKKKKSFMPKKQILIYPVTYNDHTENSPFNSVHENGSEWLLTSKKINEYMELYVKNKKDLNNYYVAPLLCNNLRKQPETLIITAEYDPLRDEGEAYGNKLMDFGNKVEMHCILDTVHGFFTTPLLQDSVAESFKYIKDFIGDDLPNEKK